MRALFAVLLLTPVVALAQSAPAVDAEVSAPISPPPALDQVRLFNTTEVFRLEPSDVRAEVHFGMDDNANAEMEVRAEVGVTKHVQLSLSEDLGELGGQALQPLATPIALRYSLGSKEGDVAGNPAFEVALIPRPNAPARASLRLILAQEVMPKLIVAANGYVEQNLNRETAAGVDGAFGMTGGISYAVVPSHLRIGAEGRIGAAQDGEPDYLLKMAAGPNVVGTLGPVTGTLTALVNLTESHLAVDPMATVGCTF